MPKTKKDQASANDPATIAALNDPRFSNFTTDPRFRLPARKHTRTKIDKRFASVLHDDEFSRTATVDRYGRKISSKGKKTALERLYVEEDGHQSDEDSNDEEGDEEDAATARKPKNIEKAYDPARGGGFSSSENDDDEDKEKVDEDESDEDDEEFEHVDIEEEGEEATFPEMQAESAAVEMGDVSTRIAVVNLDWDNIRAIDLMAVFSSFVKPGGKILNISIYQSDFGKERMEREELEGPPKEIFSQREAEAIESDNESLDEEEIEEKIKQDLLKPDDGKEFDSSALRKYQLERLRYYYAVVICSDAATAQHIYESTDGTEYLSSANFFDLRFVPDGVEFDDKPRDEATSVPSSYRPTDFITDALQHSKVKLTWDMDPAEATRKDAIKRAFGGSRAELGENDLKAYLGSDSEEDEEMEIDHDEGNEKEHEQDSVTKISKKDLARQKMRQALGLTKEPTHSSKNESTAPVGDMQVTFTPGLSASSSSKTKGIFENEPQLDETTAEKYVRREKERKSRRKEKAKAIREGRDPNASINDEKEDSPVEDLGFKDSFFTVDEAGSKDKAFKVNTLRKEERKQKRDAKIEAETADAKSRAELELLMADDIDDDEPTMTGDKLRSKKLEHFNMKEILKAEKQARRDKKGKGKKRDKDGVIEAATVTDQDNFEIDTSDTRFFASGKGVFESHEYAIDTSNPRFMDTRAMKGVLEEGRRRRKVDDEGEEHGNHSEKRRKDNGKQDEDLNGLVERVKKRAKLGK